MEGRINHMKQLAMKCISCLYNRNQKLPETEIETLRLYLYEVGEYDDGMTLEEMACLVLLYEIEQEKANNLNGSTTNRRLRNLGQAPERPRVWRETFVLWARTLQRSK